LLEEGEFLHVFLVNKQDEVFYGVSGGCVGRFGLREDYGVAGSPTAEGALVYAYLAVLFVYDR
jgi:hypothetical protein